MWASYGGAVFNYGTLAIRNSGLVQNTALRFGGGSWTLTPPVLRHTTIAGNSRHDISVE
jgi:hypothetical protein